MAIHTHCLVLPSTYRDSVMLLALSRTLESLPSVRQAAVMMGAPQHKTLLQEAGLLTAAAATATANDLLICVQADTVAAAEQALQQAQQQLSQRQAVADAAAERAPRTLETALRRLPDANLACIAVPGQYALHETRKALQHGLHVFLFSAHVTLQAEAELKQLAAQHGLLLMGPDCGTAILNGVPLGFANQVRRGPVGLISASGTGLQQVSCLLARRGLGISQAIGVGGRDLHRHIGARSMRAALQALGNDAQTQVIVLISKPPDMAVAAHLTREAAQLGKPCILAFLGNSMRPEDAIDIHRASTLEEAAGIAAALVRGKTLPSSPPALPSDLLAAAQQARAALRPEQHTISALYCGGTLAYEALWLLRRSVGTVTSNLDKTLATAGHVVLDLGAEEFTRTRPHPMIDPAGRRQHLLQTVQQPEVAVVLCDVLLGWGAHPDPAGALAAAWQEARKLVRAAGRKVVGIASVCGTADDPQGYVRQCAVLREHGFFVAASNAQAVRLATAVLGHSEAAAGSGEQMRTSQPTTLFPGLEPTAPEIPAHLAALLTAGPRVINLGPELFAAPLVASGVPVVHVDWQPPAGGNARLAHLLERLR